MEGKINKRILNELMDVVRELPLEEQITVLSVAKGLERRINKSDIRYGVVEETKYKPI